LPGRISTGSTNLDNLLLGGIPENYAVIMTASPSDEREQLIKNFLQAGLTNGKITFFISTEPGNVASIAKEFQSTLYLFICNPQADAMVQDIPNVFKLKGVEDLTEIEIALAKAFRNLNPSVVDTKRICIEIISDVLLQHNALTTRRWLSELLPMLRAKGFTSLAVVDPNMHAAEDVEAILSVFEGEIRVSEKETPEGTKQTLKIHKLHEQKYMENEITLTKEK
jgi:KaiC/GvpD/RAD55 family RecA-like ATPase